MKKMLLLLAVALAVPFVFISCDDDKNEPAVLDNHEYVDLGLPSGTLWATCNVGADSPEEYGDYFAWGETEPKDVYEWNNYKWAHWVFDTITDHYYRVVEETWYKYYNRSWTSDGFVEEGDGKTELDLEDDAAYVNMGSNWRTPTLEQLQELVEKCIWERTQRNGVYGYLVTGRNGKSIFMPASGARSSRLYNDGRCAYYWSRTLCSREKLALESADQNQAYILFFNEWGKKHVWYDSRYDGNTIRAVRTARK